MQGDAWAKTPAEEFFIILVVDGKGYVPGAEPLPKALARC
jgi:hypothetical protein